MAENHKKWGKDLQLIAMGIRAAKHESTGFSPAELTLGRKIKLPCDIPAGLETIDQVQPSVWAATLTRRLRDAMRLAREAMNEQGLRDKARLDQNRRDVQFTVGQMVWKRNHPLLNKADSFAAKLAPKWLGPYSIRQVLTPLTYTLDDHVTGKQLAGSHHINQLKPHSSEGEEVAEPDSTPLP